MKIAVYSDVHLEFARFTPPSGLKADVVVLAGDIHAPARKIAPWAAKQAAFKGKVVIHVAGNHEFYRGVMG
jgi:predicted phosphodiesterase